MRFSTILFAVAAIVAVAQAAPTAEPLVKRTDCANTNIVLGAGQSTTCDDCSIKNTSGSTQTMYASDNGPAIERCHNLEHGECFQEWAYRYCQQGYPRPPPTKPCPHCD